MSSTALLQKLALERCQHNLAQLCAVAFLSKNQAEAEAASCLETVRLLVEAIDRDLNFLQDYTLAERDFEDTLKKSA